MHVRHVATTFTVIASAWLASAAAAAPPSSDAPIVYNRDIRPILSDNCFYCHGPDKNHRDGKFRLDERDSAVARGAITPGKPAESEMIARILTSNEDELMPPPASHKKLDDRQKRLLERWVAEGAQYQPHWAYITPSRPAAPKVADAKWARNPIDAFVLAELQSRGLAPSAEADRATLLRRLSLDLIGLPPTPAELKSFLDDASPDAYEKQVDRLLASPQYGERMAVPWLDVVRFADTVGFHGDQNQNVFPYRDYVINAFNGNKPFDVFTTEQLAGDLLPNPTTEQRVATGFNRLNMVTREGGAQPKEYLAKYAADRVRTVGTAFLGSTFGCAECHDHKFDPITAADFYSLSAYFADVKQWGVYTDYSYTPNPDLPGWTNDHPFPPELVVESPYLMTRLRREQSTLDATLRAAGDGIARDERRRGVFDAWRREASAYLKANPSGWTPATPTDTLPANATAADDGSVVFAGKMADDVLELAVPPGPVASVRLEFLPHEKHGGSIARAKVGGFRSPGWDFNVKLVDAAGVETPLEVARADADLKDSRYANGFAVLGIADGWSTSSGHLTSRQTGVYVLAAPPRAEAGSRLVVTMKRNRAAAVRVSVSPIAHALPPAPDFAATLRAKLDGGDVAAPLLAYAQSTGAEPELLAAVRASQRETDTLRGGRTPTVVTEAWEPRVTRVLPRGNWQDDTGTVVEPAPPHFLPKGEPVSGRRATRLDLANWITSEDNPLAARTVVNRFWKQFFGSGLCNSVDDLGAQGEWPSHPELLDWLAVEFREPSAPESSSRGAAHAWDVKHVVRLMVTSATYRQDSNLRPELRESDPTNRLLSAQSPRRLEAEFVRDNALLAAGLLNLSDVGGPSAKPFQPAGYYENLQFPNRDYAADADDRQYRRGLYSHWQRTFLHPMLANFDAPGREECTAVRVVSNTPQQALTLLNDPSFVEAARVLAARAIAESPSDDARLEFAFLRVLARPPKAAERESMKKFLSAQRAQISIGQDEPAKLAAVGGSPVPAGVDPNELAAWTGVCRVVLNLHESITRY